MTRKLNVKEVFLNREEERAIFREMLEGRRREHILLIQAEGGMGKTHLLEEFWALAEPFPRARLDLKSGYSLERVLFRLCEDMGLDQFTSFYGICVEVAGGPSLVSDDQQQMRDLLITHFSLEDLRLLSDDLGIDFEELRGETLSMKALSLVQYMRRRLRYDELTEMVREKRPSLGGDLARLSQPVRPFSFVTWSQAESRLSSMPSEDRGRFHDLLTGALIEDLQRLRTRAVMLFDTFDRDRGSREIKDWLSQLFLPKARLLPNLIVVVAGRDIPRLSDDAYDWCLKCELHGLDPDHIREFVERLELTIDDETIRVIYRGSRGQPLLLAQILENWMSGEVR